MQDNVRQELKELCYFIIENNNALSRPEQLTRVQMLYERLLVLNYLEEVADEQKQKSAAQAAPKPKSNPPKAESSPSEPKSLDPEPIIEKKTIKDSEANIPEPTTEPKPPSQEKPSTDNTERRGLNDEHQAPKSVNDNLAKGAIQVGLNDRIAFVKHLFNDSQSDFNRVLSQLNTLDTYLESMYFIENLVKPDYNWDDKKAYEDRLINLIKKRFGEDW